MTPEGLEPRTDAPPHAASLKARIRNQTQNELEAARLERTVALVALGQMLLACEVEGTDPGQVAAAIKGGTAMRIRYGPSNSRFSRDFDTARATDLASFVEAFDTALAQGWGGFSGEIRPSRSLARPRGVPEQYVMVAYDVKLRYGRVGLSKSFITVPLEIGADELDDTQDPPRVLDREVALLFGRLGLPEPQPLPVIADAHQIAQKLHAVSAPGSERAHDLIDLQLLARDTGATDAEIARTCERLFAFRRQHAWPPGIEAGVDWESLYAAQLGPLDVLPNIVLAVQWANEYIQRLSAAR
jgi:hypothetical protein